MRRVNVEDGADSFFPLGYALQGVTEPNAFVGAMTLHIPTEHFAGPDSQSVEQRCGSVAPEIMNHSYSMAAPYRDRATYGRKLKFDTSRRRASLPYALVG